MTTNEIRRNIEFSVMISGTKAHQDDIDRLADPAGHVPWDVLERLTIMAAERAANAPLTHLMAAADNPDDESVTWDNIIDVAIEHYTHVVLYGARFPSRSTSPVSNILETMTLANKAQILQDLNRLKAHMAKEA